MFYWRIFVTLELNELNQLTCIAVISNVNFTQNLGLDILSVPVKITLELM